MSKRLLLILAAVCAATGASAQEAWLQIAARPSAEETVAAARDYARRLDDVAAFALRGSRYSAIVLGPYEAREIESRRRMLRARGLIPADSYATDGARFAERLFPPPDAGIPAEAASGRDAGSAADARRAERRLSEQERRDLQVALRWAGHYDGAIDGAFGQGTRAAMASWQRANDHAATGVMTPAQRQDLLAAYEAVLDGLGLRPVTDERAGITVDMPTALVAFDRYAPPFAHYPAREGAEIPARVILISREGGRDELRGLYEAMQTLEIVPREGERSRSADGFSITGRGNEIVSQTELRLRDGNLKGFTLVWPAGDEARRSRVVDEMEASFRTDPARVLSETTGAGAEEQTRDLLSGLQVRQPALTRSGFYVSPRGDVLTTAAAVAQCARITLDGDIEARVTRVAEETGLALLAPERPLAPRAHAALAGEVPRRDSEAVLAGYSYGGQLGAPSLVRGRLADLRGLDGEDHLRRYALPARASDAGGPVLNPAGAVLGAAAEPPDGARRLPDGVALATDAEAIRDLLVSAGVSPATREGGTPLPRGRLQTLASDMTVLVGCWR